MKTPRTFLLALGCLLLEATLQSAPTPTGPWSKVNDATSAHTLNAGDPRQFYRLSDEP